MRQQSMIKPKLLLVDDQEYLLKITISIIERIRQGMLLNFDVITASNGEEAYHKYMEHYKEIRVIVMDI